MSNAHSSPVTSSPSQRISLPDKQPRVEYTPNNRRDAEHDVRPIVDTTARMYSNQLRDHASYAVPTLPSELRSQNGPVGAVPPMQSFDPSDTLDLHSLHISEPPTRASSLVSHISDPIPRAGSSMSVQPPQYTQHDHHNLRHANTLPSASHHGLAPHDAYVDGDAASMYSRHSAGSGLEDTQLAYAYQEQQFQPTHANSLYVDHAVPQAGWADSSFARYPPVGQADAFNPLYAAASDVLGMGPPPIQTNFAPANPPDGGASYANGYPQYAHSDSPSIIEHPSAYHGMLQSGGPSRGPSASYASSYMSPISTTSLPNSAEDEEIVLRPPLHRHGTTASVNLRTLKSKAVDLTAPPYTKEYIDEYRQRIKADPDPEAHFLYAKYLIEAAKRIGAEAKDQRAVKKYRDFLITESLKVIRRLATQGEAYDEAQFFLANCYGTGMLGLQVDHEKAYHLYLQAAKQNHAAACYRVAVCNEIGAGTRKEPPRAAAFYRKAASLGDTAAMYKLGMILLQGSLGEAKSPKEAINWLTRAAEQADEENPHALHELGLLHESPNSGVVHHDPVYARNLYTRAAHLGYTQSQYKLGQCYEYGALTCPVDPRRSIAWYTKAAEKGNPEAELALSGWYLTGSEGVLKQSDSEAYLWARRAANKGLSKAEYAVGYYAEMGIGIKQDIEFAKRWYMRAAAQSNKRAMNRLTEMKRMGNKRTNVSRPTRQQAKDECVIC